MTSMPDSTMQQILRMRVREALMEAEEAKIRAATEELNKRNRMEVALLAQKMGLGFQDLWDKLCPPHELREMQERRDARRANMPPMPLPAGVDPRSLEWLPKDTSMFPSPKTDNVYINGKVYSQALGQIMFELPHEEYIHYETSSEDGDQTDSGNEDVIMANESTQN